MAGARVNASARGSRPTLPAAGPVPPPRTPHPAPRPVPRPDRPGRAHLLQHLVQRLRPRQAVCAQAARLAALRAQRGRLGAHQRLVQRAHLRGRAVGAGPAPSRRPAPPRRPDPSPGGSAAPPPARPGGSVPGDLGNQLEAKLDKPSVVHYLCFKRTDSYFTLWLNLELLLPVIIDCWIDNIRLIYNKTSRTTQFPDGVDVRVPGFGKTFSVEFLDPSKSSVGSYFHTMVESLISWGYTRGEDVRGAPYDWRRAPNENGLYFLALQEMIEEMYQLYGGPVVLVAHSMGNMYTLYFLQRQPQAWKDKYIRAFLSLGAPWGGVAKTLRVLASGDNNRIPVIGSLKIREQQRSAVSTSWLLPYNYTWSPDKVFVYTPMANYTLRDYQRFFQDIGFEDGWHMRQDTEGLVDITTPPGVELHCLYGTGVPTSDSFYYENFPDREPKICYGDGDGTVNLQSALRCEAWRGHQEQQVSLLELPGSEHIEMLANATTLAYLKNLLLKP